MFLKGWIRRSDHDAAMRQVTKYAADWQSVANEYREQLKEQREANRALVRQFVDLKHAGFATPAPQPAPASPPKADPVQDAIALAAGTRGDLRRHLGVWARTQRTQGVKDDDIVHNIINWGPGDDEGVPE